MSYSHLDYFSSGKSGKGSKGSAKSGTFVAFFECCYNMVHLNRKSSTLHHVEHYLSFVLYSMVFVRIISLSYTISLALFYVYGL